MAGLGGQQRSRTDLGPQNSLAGSIVLGDRTKRRYSGRKGFAAGANAKELNTPPSLPFEMLDMGRGWAKALNSRNDLTAE
jgi:hypothetical protein